MHQMQVNRAAVDNVEIIEVAETPLAPGQARIQIERLAITANTITYASIGEVIGYWKFFPIDREGFGQVPAWGFGIVTKTTGPLEVGSRYYGFWPIATSVVVTPENVRDTGFVDGAAHRKDLPQIYNAYYTTPNSDDDDLRALLQPLLATSCLLDDFLSESAFFGAEQIVIGSASSKTGIGLAHFLAARKPNGPKIVGLTGTGNVSFCNGLGLYDQVVAYDNIIDEIEQNPATFVDMAGSATVRLALHSHLGDMLKYSCAVGMSHWNQLGSDKNLPGVKPTLFFAPGWADKRRKDWGSAELGKKMDASWRGIAKESSSWLSVAHHNGLDSVPAIWASITGGSSRPDIGNVVVMGG